MVTSLPARAGVGLKPDHYAAILQTRPDVGWFEVHPENFMGAGGPPHHFLTRIRAEYPLSLHGVGLSIGGAGPLDQAHLARLKVLVDRYQPASFSEHLAWSTHDTGFLNDLLPLPYTRETLDLVCDHVDEVQAALGCRMLIENPSTYVGFAADDYDEITFLSEIARRTGCGLLLDVNNVYVSSTNHGRDAEAYIRAFPFAHVGEIHLAGHDTQADDLGRPLLIDTHDRPVIDAVWDLYALAIRHGGALPTLIEWDGDIPDWPVLMREASTAEVVMSACVARREASDVAA